MIIYPSRLSGTLIAPPSKSLAHRVLIASALADLPTKIVLDEFSRDIRATIDCLTVLGAKFNPIAGGVEVSPITFPVSEVDLPCGESGSTLRFLMPVVGILGVSAVFSTEGRLSERPMSDYEDELIRHGMKITHSGNKIHCSGRLTSGNFRISGNISSQFLSGLLLALPLVDHESTVTITTPLESSGYVDLTLNVLSHFGAKIEQSANQYRIISSKKYRFPDFYTIEGDYSSSAFFLCAGALSSNGVAVKNLLPNSLQADRALIEILRNIGAEVSVDRDVVTVRRRSLNGFEIDASAIPDLIAPLSVVAALSCGKSRIFHAERLRYKESDRLTAIQEMLCSLGADVKCENNELFINGKTELYGGCVKTYHDHRIAMSAAIASVACKNPVILDDADCVDKSYPHFWGEFHRLEAKNEQ